MLGVLLLTATALATTLRPDAFEDVPSAGGCTLREAVQAANTNAPVNGCPAGSNVDVDVIVLEAGVYTLDTFAFDDDNTTGDLDVIGTLVVRGAGMDATTVTGAGGDRVFDGRPGSTLTLQDLEVTGGVAGLSEDPTTLDGGSPVGLFQMAAGGGVRAETLTLLRVAVRGNASGLWDYTIPAAGCSLGGAAHLTSGGGGVFVSGVTHIQSSIIADNTVPTGTFANGGRIPGVGGGLFIFGSATVDDSLVTGNRVGLETPDPLATGADAWAGGGGGIFANDVVLTNTTVVGNQARRGGGVGGFATLNHSTVTGNTAVIGGGVDAQAGTQLTGTVLAGNTAPTSPDCSGTLVTGGYALVGSLAGCTMDLAPGAPSGTDRVDVDPRLGPLSDNGGPLPTVLPAADSPAVDAAGGTCDLDHDARGAPRPIGAGCDIGAVETGCGDGTLQAGEECDAVSSPDCLLCLENTCGDGVPNVPFEACDDGDANSDTLPDACRTDCALASCGDAVIDHGETCDDAGFSAACDDDCSPATCGDGTTNPVTEACDDGADNHDWRPDACRTDCAVSTCGDGVKDQGEGCDHGDANGDDPTGCRADCAWWSCGDGVVDAGEDCDDGDGNSDDPDACRPTCVLPTCGDGVRDGGEDCDDGSANGADPDACRADCTLPYCGDGVTDTGEQCDDGPNNGTLPSGCRADCVSATCGDGVRDGGEACDDGDANADAADACRTDCTDPTCGDGILDTGEACDDGAANGADPDACRLDCTVATCGDGVLDADEACDDGPANGSGPNACRATCAFPTCGDGVVDFGEQCDDANGAGDDGCTACAVDEGWECALGDGGSVCAERSGCGGGNSSWILLFPLVFLRRARRSA